MEIEALYNLFREHPEVSTDTRKISPGCLFFALKGEHFNANAFADEALTKGAAYAVVDEAGYVSGNRCILVDDVLETLQKLAAHHRQQLNIPFIAICGSNGKTTTKELLATVLDKKYRTHATRGNLNNHIGVPLTLLSITGETEMAVIEIGANHIGETAALCGIAQPDFGLVTNNGKDHLEGFGSIEGVRVANAELYRWLEHTGGVAFVNAMHPDLLAASGSLNRKLYGAAANSDYAIYPLKGAFLAGVRTEDPGMEIRSHLAGLFNWENIAAAVAIGRYFEVPDADIREAIESYRPGMNRSQVMEKNGTTFLLDCYNANPSSMELAIESFAAAPGSPKGVILGDMLELGEYSDAEHAAIIALVKRKHFDRVILVGKIFGSLKDEIPSVHFATSAEARSWFLEQDWKGWNFLLKGSRGYQLETIVL